jgi:hypothetical protein
MIDDKMEVVIRRLHAKTASGELRWNESHNGKEYQANFSRHTVGLSMNEEGIIYLRLYDSFGKLLEQTSDYEVTNSSYYGLADVVKQLYEQARRQALGVDDALDELLGELN